MIENPIEKALVGRSQTVEEAVEGVVEAPDELGEGEGGGFRISEFGFRICRVRQVVISRRFN
jgi:hypothetical protein